MRSVLMIFLTSISLMAGFIQSVEQSVASAYPEGSAEKQNVLLSAAQAKALKEVAGIAPNSRIVSFYKIKKGEEILAYGVLQTSLVRSKKQTLLVYITPKGQIAHIDVLAFYEPKEYLPSEKWLSELEAKTLADPIRPKRDLPNMTGATLSANATAKSARLSLGAWKVVFGDAQ